MDVMLSSCEYNQIEKDIDQRTEFSNILNSDENGESNSMRGNSSQEMKIETSLKDRTNPNLKRIWICCLMK